jgi:hypothetical protein
MQKYSVRDVSFNKTKKSGLHWPDSPASMAKLKSLAKGNYQSIKHTNNIKGKNHF